MRHVVGDVMYLLIFVDDILLLVEQRKIERMKEVFWGAFHVDSDGSTAEKHSYLGMLISLHPGEVIVDMEFYARKVLEEYNNLPLANFPAKKKLFEEGTKRVVLANAERKKFT
jgi:hypothetical protein